MLTQSDPKENTSVAITPEIRPSMPWRVTAVQALDGYRLKIRFMDGLEGEADLSGMVHSAAAGVFARLADPDIFAQVFVALGAVTWPGEIDLAPDAMHAEIQKTGKWLWLPPAQ